MSAPTAPADVLYLWTVYDHPADMPDLFVARRWWISYGTAGSTNETITSPHLHHVRAALAGEGLTRIDRAAADDPVIVEVWL